MTLLRMQITKSFRRPHTVTHHAGTCLAALTCSEHADEEGKGAGFARESVRQRRLIAKSEENFWSDGGAQCARLNERRRKA